MKRPHSARTTIPYRPPKRKPTIGITCKSEIQTTAKSTLLLVIFGDEAGS
jgi:hypothetical protein